MALPTNPLPLSAVDFCGKQVMDFKEAFWTSTFNNPALGELLTVIPDVRGKQQIVILGLLKRVGKKINTDTCAPEASTETIPSVQKFMEPKGVEDRFEECWKNLLAKFYVWGLQKGIKKPDLSGTDFANFMEDRIIDALVQSVYRIVWFAQTDAANVSGGGLITNGIDVDYINTIDGIWDQLFAIAAANPSQKYTIPNNHLGLATPVVPVPTGSGSGGTLAAATYYIKVAAVNGSGVSIASPEASATTTGSTSSISVAYTAVTGATGYRIYVGTTSGAQTVYFADADGSPFVITTLSGALTGSPQTVNTATTYAAQKFTATDTTNQLITGIFQEMVDNMDDRLVAEGEVKFFVTRTVGNQYKAERRKFTCIDQAYMRTETGWDYLEFDGIRVIVLPFEDRIIKEYFDNGTSYYLPHRIYLTATTQIHMSTDDEGSMNDVEAFYDPKSKEYFFDTLYFVDVTLIEDYKFIVAY